jgi:hypothetical protein
LTELLIAEHPVLKVKRSYEAPAVGSPVEAVAVVEVVAGE